MNKFRAFIIILKTPKTWFAILYSVLSLIVMVCTIVLVCLGYTNNYLVYLLYGVSAIALTYLVYIVIYFIPKIKGFVVKTLKKHKFTNELLESYGYRSII